MQYALRTCLEQRRLRTSVHLYAAIGLYDDAVELALTGVDVQLARHVCSTPCGPDDTDLRKRLWLRVASWVVAREGSTAKDAISILHDSGGVLRVEDVLVFFPDLTLIDDFKASQRVLLLWSKSHIPLILWSMSHIPLILLLFY